MSLKRKIKRSSTMSLFWKGFNHALTQEFLQTKGRKPTFSEIREARQALLSEWDKREKNKKNEK